jgi:hypothetical protein
MSALKKICLIGLITSIFACTPPVTFNEPQPPDVSDLSKFPKRLLGNYMSESDGSILHISEKTMERVYDFDQKVHPSQLDSTSVLNGDTIIYLTTNQREIIQREGDSLIVHHHVVDTMFLMNYDNVVRKYKGYYFLNIRYDKESWEVKKVDLSKGKLTISSISSKEDIENLKAIAASSNDTTAPYTFTTTKKQFKEFIKSDGFSDSEVFRKVD